MRELTEEGVQRVERAAELRREGFTYEQIAWELSDERQCTTPWWIYAHLNPEKTPQQVASWMARQHPNPTGARRGRLSTTRMHRAEWKRQISGSWHTSNPTHGGQMKNSERVEGLRAVKSQFTENTAQVKQLNQEMRAFVADPGKPETQSQRADELGEQLRSLQEDREQILRRLTEVDPAFAAERN